jgi:hypothetical protein
MEERGCVTPADIDPVEILAALLIGEGSPGFSPRNSRRSLTSRAQIRTPSH